MKKINYILLIGAIVLVWGLTCGAQSYQRPQTLADNPHYTFEDYSVTNDFVRTGTDYKYAETKQHYGTDLDYNYNASYPTVQTRADLEPSGR